MVPANALLEDHDVQYDDLAGDRRRPTEDQGSPTVEPQSSRKRKRKRSPSDLRAKARRVTERIEAASRDRRDAWEEGEQPNLVELRTHELEGLHARKRELRRELYAKAPALEGQPVYRARSGRAAS